ncbi:MAG TPA: sulfocyanin-like copper-binding protein [Gemmatimonadales bacterium]
MATVVACAGGSQTRPAPQTPTRIEPAPAASVAPSSRAAVDWLVVDSANRTATISLEVTHPPGAPSALLNGYRAGEARVIAPRGWTIKWNWRNSDATSVHSLVVMTQREKIPLEGGRPAFMNAMTRMLTGGLPAGQSDQTTFEADEAGWFWIMCGVPEHAVQGEWLELRVDPEATTARAEIKKPATGASQQ